jgi:hypothetical protein
MLIVAAVPRPSYAAEARTHPCSFFLSKWKNPKVYAFQRLAVNSNAARAPFAGKKNPKRNRFGFNPHRERRVEETTA